MEIKLELDQNRIARSRKNAGKIAADVYKTIDTHSTVAVERSICRLLGIDGVDARSIPLPNVIIDGLHEKNRLSSGIAYYMGNAVAYTGLSPEEIAKKVTDNQLNLLEMPFTDTFEARNALRPWVKMGLTKITTNRNEREDQLKQEGDKQGPYLYVIVATGNIYHDIDQAVAAAEQGADIIAVIRTTGQSLLDYVPHGATTEGFGGTYATQQNFKLMREALDKVGHRLGTYIRLCNYCSGLCMPEIAAIGALERLDVMLNDALYGILFRDINMKRTLIDQHFSRVINGYAGIIINTGEDNYLTTADAVEEAHTVLASQFINEQFALSAGIPEKQMGLGHAFEIDPSIKDGFLYEIAQAQMAREIFPEAPLKYMPPTKFMTGNIFMGYAQNTLFNVVSILTGQKIHLLGMLTEAIHTPFLSDRALAIENAKYVFNNMESIQHEILFKKDGIIENRAKAVLNAADELLEEIAFEGLFKTIENGRLAGIKRQPDGGRGLDGVFAKDEIYFNPFMESMLGGEQI